MRKGRPTERGNAIIETALMLPWLFFLFIGILNIGFFTYAAICIQSAARVAAMEAAADSPTQATACQAALGELKSLPGASGLTTCATSAGSLSDGQPVYVSTPVVLNNTTTPPCADCGANPASKSVLVSVTYRTLPMVPIPGILASRWNLTRRAEMRMP